MKVTVVPAQVTTVEDRIAGNLGLSQLMLLIAPIFIGSALYVILPPTMHGASYKLVVIASLACISGLLAVRIKGKLLLFWLVIILRYNVRPQFYVFNKNSLALREEYADSNVTKTEPEMKLELPARTRSPKLTATDTFHVQSLLENPAANVSFVTNKKGVLNVLITEVKEQS